MADLLGFSFFEPKGPDLTLLSDSDLIAYKNNDYERISDDGLLVLAGKKTSTALQDQQRSMPSDSPVSYTPPPYKPKEGLTDAEIFQGLSQQQVAKILDQVITEPSGGQFFGQPTTGYNQVEAKRLADIERLRNQNPAMAEMIEEMSPLEAAHVGAGAAVAKVGMGTGIMEDDPIARENYETLRETRPAAGIGEMAMEATEGALAGYAGLAGIASTPIRMATGAAMGTGGEMVRAKGEGVNWDDPEMWVRSTFGGLMGLIAGRAVPGNITPAQQEIADALTWTAPSAPLEDIITRVQAGADTPALLNYFENPQGIEDLVPGDLGMDHPMVQGFKEKVEEGIPPKEALLEVFEEADEILSQDKLAQYYRDGQGKVRTNPAARELERQGVEPGAVRVIAGAGEEDLGMMRRQWEIFKKGRENKKYRDNNRPAQIVGEVLDQRFNFVNAVRRDAGEQLNKITRNPDVADLPISTEGITPDFYNDLALEGVGFGDDGLIFLDSTFEDITGGSINALKNTYDRLQRMGPNPSFAQMHRLKRYIYNTVYAGKKSEGGISGEASNILKGLAERINTTLGNRIPEYADANFQYSTALNAMDAFQKAVGTSVNLMGENADKALGTAARKLTNETIGRANMLNALGDIDKIVYNMGGRPDDSIYVQNMFANLLDETFQGTAGSTSFRGIIGNEIRNAVRSGNTKDKMFDAAGNLVQDARGLNEEGLINAFETLLFK